MSEPIRILHVIGRMGTGGAESLLMNLYRNVDRNKVQFDFVVHTTKEYRYDKEINSLGGNIYRVPRFNGINILSYTKAWFKIFKEHPECRIIHAHITSTAFIFFPIARAYGLITIAHSHSTKADYGILSIVKFITQLPIRYIANYRFACSKKAGIWLYGKHKEFSIINNAIDTVKYKYNINTRNLMRKELNLNNKIVIGHVGRLNFIKRQAFIIEILDYLINKKEMKDFVFLCVGEGQDKDNLIRLVNDLNLSNYVIFTDVRVDIPELLQAMDIMIFPSLYEGLPLTLIEAQSAGLPSLISSNITDEVVITKLVTKFNIEESAKIWAEKALDILASHERRDMSSEIKSSGYDILQVTKHLETFYLSTFNCSTRNNEHS